MSLLTEALAPTNFLAGNPAAIKRAVETGGGSLLHGLQNLLQDIATNGGMPSQVDKSAFQVGENLALSPGAVVFRNEVLELIQYAPAGEQVYSRPLLLVPPQINKYWNNDSTRLPARLHGEFLDLLQLNPFKNPGSLKLLGRSIDVGKVECDAYVLAGVTDHITPWKTCYATTQLLTGRREFVLSSSGHIQSIINPPGNPKAKFFTNPQFPADADEWLAKAQPPVLVAPHRSTDAGSGRQG